MHANRAQRTEVARRMFRLRFGDEDLGDHSIKTLMGLEGQRVRALYAELGAQYGVTWKGRRYDPSNWELADPLNRAISAANAALYALTTAVVCSMGYLPQLGFVHSSGALPFVYDLADLYKPETSLQAAFQTLALSPDVDEQAVLVRLKARIEETGLVSSLPRDLERLLDFS